jgi:hypothetical protein
MVHIASMPKASSTPPSVVQDGSTIEKSIKKTIEGIQMLLNPQYGNTTHEEEMQQ